MDEDEDDTLCPDDYEEDCAGNQMDNMDLQEHTTNFHDNDTEMNYDSGDKAYTMQDKLMADMDVDSPSYELAAITRDATDSWKGSEKSVMTDGSAAVTRGTNQTSAVGLLINLATTTNNKAITKTTGGLGPNGKPIIKNKNSTNNGNEYGATSNSPTASNNFQQEQEGPFGNTIHHDDQRASAPSNSHPMLS
jgi:hypothetical protein